MKFNEVYLVNRMQLVSFKISDDIAEKLKELKGDEVSISLVAKRLLLDHIEGAQRKTTLDEKLDLILEEIKQLKSQPSQPIANTTTQSRQAIEESHGQPSQPVCTYCGSTGHHTNKGVRNNKRRWLCVDCGKSFSVDIGAA